MKTIDLPPYAPTLIESTRAIGYSLEAAIADIIDNSIAASASHVSIQFFPVDDEYISILDDGKGMTAQELNTAMQYGSRSPTDIRNEKDLGRFGLGLKTASLSQCRCLTVVTKQENTIEGRRWDIDHVIGAGSWSLIVVEPSEFSTLPGYSELMKQASGTLVVWQKLDKLKAGEISFQNTMAKKFESVQNHLSLVYHRYLSGEKGLKKLSITINGVEVEPVDPFLTKKSVQVMDDEILVVRGQKILVRPYILPHISKMTQSEINQLGGEEGLRRLQGFYVYRNKRLLVWGTWFKMMRQGEMSKLARIQVDIPNTLDDLWTLDIKKSSAVPPAEVKKNLESVIEKLAKKSRRTWTFRGKKETGDKYVHVWNRMKSKEGGHYYEINRKHPLVAQLLEHDESTRKMTEMLLRQIETQLPLNQLYLDMNNDEKLENDSEISEKEIKEDLLGIISRFNTDEEKTNFLYSAGMVEPFSNYPDVIDEIMREL